MVGWIAESWETVRTGVLVVRVAGAGGFSTYRGRLSTISATSTCLSGRG
jgi:hypothetical protein